MCWKQEWAMAINNLERAKEHIAKARAKLQARKARNEKNLERLRRNKKYNYPKVIEPVQTIITKNQLGIDECNQVIDTVKAKQDQLFRMIHVYGIRHSESPQRVYQLMGKYTIPQAVFEGTHMIFERGKEAES